MDKFSELKAVAATYSVALNAHRENPTDKGALYAWDEATTAFSRAISNREMEIIIALLAELEAKDKRIAELEPEPTIKHMRSVEESLICATDRVSELEARLATPVRFPDCDTEAVSIMAHWLTDEEVNAWVKGIEFAKQQIRAAGFTVDGDE